MTTEGQPPPALGRAGLNQILRHDLVSFIQRCFQTVSPGDRYAHNWHVEVIAAALTDCLAGRCTRLIITLPPRYLKSISASVAFPAWALGHRPDLRIICASYAAELAAKHARDCRAIMDSDWYRSVFPRMRIDRRRTAELDFMTTERGFRLATSIGGTLTGRGGNLIILDDPLKADDALSEARRTDAQQWFDGTLYSRLDDKARDAIIVITQRLHPEDLVGHLLGKDDGWRHISLPAIATDDEQLLLPGGRIVGRREGEPLHPAREPREVLERIRSNLGSYAFSAQYQQEPLPAEGNMIRWTWFRFYDPPLERQPGDFVTQSWDTAYKPAEFHDYSVCTTWLRRGEDHCLLDVLRARLEYPYLRQKIVEMAGRHAADAVLIEDRGSGTSLIQDLRSEGHVRPIPIQPEADKITRMAGQSARIEAGHVLLPKTAPWIDDFRAEFLQFPHGRHDDQVDSLSQYLGWCGSRPSGMEDAIIYARRSPILEEWERMFGTEHSEALRADAPAPWEF